MPISPGECSTGNAAAVQLPVCSCNTPNEDILTLVNEVTTLTYADPDPVRACRASGEYYVENVCPTPLGAPSEMQARTERRASELLFCSTAYMAARVCARAACFTRHSFARCSSVQLHIWLTLFLSFAAPTSAPTAGPTAPPTSPAPTPIPTPYACSPNLFIRASLFCETAEDWYSPADILYPAGTLCDSIPPLTPDECNPGPPITTVPAIMFIEVCNFYESAATVREDRLEINFGGSTVVNTLFAAGVAIESEACVHGTTLPYELPLCACQHSVNPFTVFSNYEVAAQVWTDSTPIFLNCEATAAYKITQPSCPTLAPTNAPTTAPPTDPGGPSFAPSTAPPTIAPTR